VVEPRVQPHGGGVQELAPRERLGGRDRGAAESVDAADLPRVDVRAVVAQDLIERAHVRAQRQLVAHRARRDKEPGLCAQ
jgi:hypothetical protein